MSTTQRKPYEPSPYAKRQATLCISIVLQEEQTQSASEPASCVAALGDDTAVVLVRIEQGLATIVSAASP